MTSNSTSAQTGLSSYSANAPKTLRKVKDRAYGGATLKSFALTVGWVAVSIVFLIPLAFFESWVVECFVVAVLFCWWAVYVKWVSSESKLEETFLFLKFFFDRYSGLHTIAKYDMKTGFLEDIFPLINIHDGGLLEFKDKTYGLLVKFFPERINEEDIENHGTSMQAVIDGLAGDTSIKFIASSKYNIRKPILERLLASMNKKNTTPKIYEYLHSIYEMIEKKEQQTIEWSFCIFLGLGKFSSLQDAKDQMDSEYPGLVDSLKEADVTVLKLTDRVEIAKEYRQMVLPVVI
jgi:hypothetical protein